MNIVSRKKEQNQIAQILNSKRPEFVVVYGRRRVGKTYLIDEYFHFKYSFYATGVNSKNKNDQLNAFHLKLKEYGDHFRKLSTLPVEDPTDLNRAQWENALDAMAGLSEFMQTRDPKDGPTNYQRVLDQYRKLEIKEGFDPDKGQEIFKKEFNVFNIIGEADIPIEDLHREADVNLHPEKKEGLVEGIIEFKNNPAAKLATRLYLDARAKLRADRKASNNWQVWEASDEMDDRGWRADNTFEKLDQYIGQVLAAARQAGKEELATGLQVAGRNLHNELIRAEEFGISPEAQRKFIQKLTPLVENFLDEIGRASCRDRA